MTVDEYKAKLEAMSSPARRKFIAGEMRLRGATFIIGEYSGEGDSGAIDNVYAQAAGPDDDPSEQDEVGYDETRLVAIPDDLNEPAQCILDAALDEAYGGWENNDGGTGQLVWDLRDNRIHIHHITYFTDSSYDYAVDGGEEEAA